MRTRVAWAASALLCCALLVGTTHAARAQGPPTDTTTALIASPIRVSAHRVEYYGDVGIIIARDGVRVTQPDGTVIQGDVFAMHLGLRRFLVAGHVRLQTSAGVMEGAGYADFLVFRRQYFVPLEPEADRWTFFNGDYAHPSKGRQMPGDAFFIPDVSGTKPYIVARSVSIDPSTYIRFTPATFVLLDGALWTPPLPPYTYNFSANQNFAVNGLSGASFDVPYNVAGSPNSLSALHYRYGEVHSWYGALEQHFVSGRGYVVASLNPATQPFKQWNLLGYQRLSPLSAVQLNTQLFTYQYGLTRPLSSNGFVDGQYIQGIRQSSVRLDVTQAYESLLAQPALGYYGDPSHPFTPNHPFTAGVLWSGYDQHLLHTGLIYRLASGYAMQHDSYGVSGSSSANVTSYYGVGSLYTPVYPGPLNTGITGSYSLGQTWLSFPNIVQIQNFTATISRRVRRNVVLIGSVVIDTTSVRNTLSILSANQTTGVVPLQNSSTGLPPMLGPFLRATNRAYGLSAALTPSPDFQVTLSATQTNYSPQQIPLVAGPPRYQLSGDVRLRITRVLFLDVQRAYFFNWGGQTWSPRFNILVTSQ